MRRSATRKPTRPSRSVTALTIFAVGLLLSSGSRGEAVPPASPGLVVDGRLEDWSSLGRAAVSAGPLRMASSERYFFLQVSFETPRLLQEESEQGSSALLWIDRDADAATGCAASRGPEAPAMVVPPGAEMAYAFALGRGTVCRDGDRFEVGFASLGLVAAPVVRAAEFEIALDRRTELSHWLLGGSAMRVGVAELRGGKIVDHGSLRAERGALPPVTVAPAFDLARPPGALRLVAYNIESDGLLDPDSERRQALGRVLRALEPDVLGVQEAYRASAEQVRSKLIKLTGSQVWQTAKEGQDLVLASRYPIRRSRLIHRFDGYGAAAAFEVEAPTGGPGDSPTSSLLTILLAHWPCCNDEQPPSERQRLEIARAMVSFLEGARSGRAGWPIAPGAPVVAMGDLNLVVSRAPLETLTVGSGLRSLELRHPNAPFVFTWRDDDSRFGPGQLDFVLISSNLEADRAFALATDTLPPDILSRWGLRSRDAATASDHLPLVADLRFNAGGRRQASARERGASD